MNLLQICPASRISPDGDILSKSSYEKGRRRGVIHGTMDFGREWMQHLADTGPWVSGGGIGRS